MEASVKKDKYDDLLKQAKRTFGSKRKKNMGYVTAWQTSGGGVRFNIPDGVAQEIDMDAGDSVGLVELPNGNFVLAKMNSGVCLSRGKKAKSITCSIKTATVADKGPYVAEIEDGLAVWGPGTFQEAE